MISRSSLWYGVLFVFCCVATSYTKAAIIANGGFESPVIAENSYDSTTPTSWTSSGVVLLFNGNGSDPIFPLPQEGNQYMDIGNFNSSLSQSFSIVSGGVYDLTWYDNTAETNVTTSPYMVAIQDSSAQIVASQAFDAYHPGLDDWQQRFLSLSLSAGNYTLTFSGAGVPQGLDSLIDNVSLDAADTGAVPEPASMALWSLGALGCAIAGYRRQRKSAPHQTQMGQV